MGAKIEPCGTPSLTHLEEVLPSGKLNINHFSVNKLVMKIYSISGAVNEFNFL